MKTYTALKSLFTNLSQNTSTGNDSLGGQLISDQHRYLLQKYFDNERTVTTTTVGSSSLTTTASLAAAATSATLTAAWANPTGYSPTTFSNGNERNVLYTKSSTAISWADGLTATATTAITSLGFQYYRLPASISKITNDTITIGEQQFSPKFVQTRAEWDLVNSLPYNSDIPNYAFLYNGQLGLFPIPSTTGNILTFNYKTKVPDLSIADYSTGTITTAAAATTAITGSGTTWTAIGAPSNTDITYLNLYLRLDPGKGDGLWYQIRQINSDTTLTLLDPIINAGTTGATYTIGQMPLLSEDFHDMLVYGALMTYFASPIGNNPNSAKEFGALYSSRLLLLEDYAGTKNVDVNLSNPPNQTNPNLFVYSSS